MRFFTDNDINGFMVQLSDPKDFPVYDHKMAKEIDRAEQPKKPCRFDRLTNQPTERILNC